MGTSLSGLTPATTFDGLLKTSDNDPIGATLKTIGTGDGTDSVLQLSNSALQVNGPTTVNGAQMTIVGATNDNTTNALVVQNSDGIELLKVRNERYAQLGTSTIGIHTLISSNANWIKGNANYLQDTSSNYYGNIGSSGIQIGNGSAAATARLQVKGSGATSATTSLLVQNSAGSDLLKVTDDGAIDFGAIGLDFSNDGSGGTMSVASDRYVKLASSLSTYSALSAHLFKTFDGSAYSEAMRITGNTNQFVGIGETTPTARLHVKGSGATSATTALLVQNSANNIFSVRDDGALLFYRATNGAELLRIEDTGTSPRLVSGNNPGKSLTLGNDTITSAFSSIQFKTWDGTAYSEAMRITGNTNQFVGIGESTPTAKLHVKVGATQDTIARFQDPLQTWSYIDIKNDSVLTDYTGIFWGSKAKIRSKEVGPVFIDCSGGVSFLDGNSAKSNINSQGAIAIGASSVPSSTQAYIKGSGATSGTTALLVQNSAGSELFKVSDNAQIDFNGNMYVNSDYKIIGRNAQNSIRYAAGELRVSVQGTSSGHRFHIYASSTATSVFSVFTQTQQVGIGNGNTALDGSAKLQVDSTTQGFLPPRMSDSERDAITSPATGLMIYDTTNNQMNYFNGSNWVAF